MEIFTVWGGKKLEVENKLDKDEELEFTILNKDGDEVSVWLTKEEINQLVYHLQKILKKVL